MLLKKARAAGSEALKLISTGIARATCRRAATPPVRRASLPEAVRPSAAPRQAPAQRGLLGDDVLRDLGAAARAERGGGTRN